MSDGLLIVGGSCAAVQIAAAARQQGYAEPIRVLTAEDSLPYQRPPLSKAYLLGATNSASLMLRGDAYYRDNNIDIELGTRVDSIDLRSRRVTTARGAHVAFNRLALATGARARPLELPGASLAGVFTLRDLPDAICIKSALDSAEHVVVVGGGFIGLEVAASAAKLGMKVTVLEAQPQLLSRACSPFTANWFAQLHLRHGARVRLGVTISELRGTSGRIQSVILADGESIPADIVVLGIGVVPNVELAARAGLACNGGIMVDRFAKTSEPTIVAAGDCTRFPCAFAAAPVRLESIQNATDQARAAAASVLGHEAPYDSVPWFWSDQFEVKLQMAGLFNDHDAHVTRGNVQEGKFSVLYFRRGVLIAMDSINRPGDHVVARKLIPMRRSFSADSAADLNFDLKSLLENAAA